jgi:hypothetical protein
MTDKTDMNGKAGKTEETVKQEPSAHTIVIPPLSFSPGAHARRSIRAGRFPADAELFRYAKTSKAFLMQLKTPRDVFRPLHASLR